MTLFFYSGHKRVSRELSLGIVTAHRTSDIPSLLMILATFGITLASRDNMHIYLRVLGYA